MNVNIKSIKMQDMPLKRYLKKIYTVECIGYGEEKGCGFVWELNPLKLSYDRFLKDGTDSERFAIGRCPGCDMWSNLVNLSILKHNTCKLKLRFILAFKKACLTHYDLFGANTNKRYFEKRINEFLTSLDNIWGYDDDSGAEDMILFDRAVGEPEPKTKIKKIENIYELLK